MFISSPNCRSTSTLPRLTPRSWPQFSPSTWAPTLLVGIAACRSSAPRYEIPENDPVPLELIENESPSAADLAGNTAATSAAPMVAAPAHVPDTIPWPAGKAPAAKAIEPTPDPDAPLPPCRASSRRGRWLRGSSCA